MNAKDARENAKVAEECGLVLVLDGGADCGLGGVESGHDFLVFTTA